MPTPDGGVPPWLPELSLSIAADSENRGGVLLHGGLAEWNGRGIVLGGPGGRGKSTAIARLPHPWRSLSDDATLVVRAPDGGYWAHPWPTWSRWLLGDSTGSCDVQHAVKLYGIYLLERDPHDRVELLGVGHAVPLLMELAEQVSRPLATSGNADGIRAMRLRRFDNICVLAKAVPAHILYLSPVGAFWQEIERHLGSV